MDTWELIDYISNKTERRETLSVILFNLFNTFISLQWRSMIMSFDNAIMKIFSLTIWLIGNKKNVQMKDEFYLGNERINKRRILRNVFVRKTSIRITIHFIEYFIWFAMERLFISKARYGEHHFEDNSLIDRLNSRYTIIGLIMAIGVITAGLFIGDSINCWTPGSIDIWIHLIIFKVSFSAQFTGMHDNYAHSFCWLKGTYYLPTDESKNEQFRFVQINFCSF